MANANNAAVGLKFQPSPAELEFQMNISGANPTPQIQIGTQVVRKSQRIAKGVYDFAVQGGALGTINLYDASFAPGISAPPGLPQSQGTAVSKGVFKPLILPYNAIVIDGMIDVITAPTSGGSATIAVSCGVTAADLKTATAIASFTGLLDLIPVGSAATSIKIVQAVTGSQGVVPFITVATAALTAGKFNVHLEYYLSD